MWRENCFCCSRASTTEYNKVAWGGQTSTTSYNIAENKRNVVSYNICLVKSLIAIKLHTTRYNTIKHNTTRWANECSISLKHQSCMMLYEMLYSFGRGFTPGIFIVVTIDNTSKGGLTIFWKLFTLILCAPKHLMSITLLFENIWISD